MLYSKPPLVRKIRNPKLKRQVYRLLPPVEALRTIHEGTPPSLTRGDMQSNAGLNGKKAQRRARIKVREFQKTARRALYPIERIVPKLDEKEVAIMNSDIERAGDRLLKKLAADQKDYEKRSARRARKDRG